MEAPAPVGEPEQLIQSVREVGAGPALLGVDLPIGAPRAWAARAGVDDFLAALDAFGSGAWARFYEPAAAPEEIAPGRPFYPARPGGTRQAHLVDGLGVADMNALRRRCDFNADGAAAATPLFWTLGAAQVGKAALHFWRTVLAPARAADAVRVWPFEGALGDLTDPARVAIAETYPAEAYGWFDLEIRKPDRKKGRQSDRAADAARLLAAGARVGATFDPAALEAIEAGFPAGGDDAFDAMVGLLALLTVVAGARPEGVPDDRAVRTVEGWILGRAAGPD